MNNTSHRKLDEIFSKFNTALAELYGDLIELSASENYRKLIIFAFNETLNDTSRFHKLISYIYCRSNEGAGTVL